MGKKILGQSPQIQKLLQMIEKVSSAKTSILITGESGTGKELVARMIHDGGVFKSKPFVPVNCGAIPENLIESELFGHKKGSFTGAVRDKEGLFEVADQGTLFLDEVGELPLHMQVKLLRVLQERTFRKVGGTDNVKVDVRIIAATNRDLEKAVNDGTFREDLYYRLNVIHLKTPPLREREGDVLFLAKHFLEQMGSRVVGKIPEFHPEVLQILDNYSWPGNVRELENVMERAIALQNDGLITVDALPPHLRTALGVGVEKVSSLGSSESSAPQVGEIRLPAPDFSKGAIDLDQILGSVEKTYLLSALKHSDGVKKKAADLLGITFRSIRYRLKKLGVSSD